MSVVDRDTEQAWQEFHKVVNMTSAQLRDWLAASEDLRAQQAPGVPREEPEGDLNSMGWRVVSILGKRRGDLTAADVELMRQVVTIARDRLESPPGQGSGSEDDWRRDLMTLGHDPLAADEVAHRPR